MADALHAHHAARGLDERRVLRCLSGWRWTDGRNVRVSARSSARRIDAGGPAVLADGTVVWTPTQRTLMAACRDGRTRWILEYYNTGQAPRVFAAGDGSIVLVGTRASPEPAAAGIERFDDYRIGGDGNVLAHHEGTLRSIFDSSSLVAIGYSDTCGLASYRYEGDGPSLEYASGGDLSSVRELRGMSAPTNDCGAWGSTVSPPYAYKRYRADGSLAFEYIGNRAVGAVGEGPIELADGSWLLVSRGGGGPAIPGMAIVGDDGSILFDGDFNLTGPGSSALTPHATLLTPEGVLYVATESVLFAIEVGIGRAPSWIGRGGSWARDNASWHRTSAP